MLVVNAGSSSLKLSLVDERDETLGEREIDARGDQLDTARLDAALSDARRRRRVGHRIVHGGDRFTAPALVDAHVESELRDLVELAPLHQTKSLAALDAVNAALPLLPAVACFDTAFHASLPEAASTYALPAEWRARWPIRRYGFHGLSHGWVARRAAAS